MFATLIRFQNIRIKLQKNAFQGPLDKELFGSSIQPCLFYKVDFISFGRGDPYKFRKNISQKLFHIKLFY